MPFPDASGKSLLHVFVYGTLRPGREAHERYCEGTVGIVSARVTGWIEMHVAGYPMLVVPPGEILAQGTGDPGKDLAIQHSWRDRVPEPVHAPVAGEVLSFDDPEVRLPVLDEYEDFLPDGSGEYDRVLLPARLANGRCVAAWTYVRPIGTR